MDRKFTQVQEHEIKVILDDWFQFSSYTAEQKELMTAAFRFGFEKGVDEGYHLLCPFLESIDTDQALKEVDTVREALESIQAAADELKSSFEDL